jgi:hypothetical protein
LTQHSIGQPVQELDLLLDRWGCVGVDAKMPLAVLNRQMGDGAQDYTTGTRAFAPATYAIRYEHGISAFLKSWWTISVRQAAHDRFEPARELDG